RYPVYLLTGLLPWSFLSQSLGRSIGSLSSECVLIRRTRMPYELIPIAMVLETAVFFVVTLAGLIAVLGVAGQLRWVILPAVVLPVVAMIAFVSSLALIVSLIDVYNRDLRWILGNLLLAWSFLLPIVYQHEAFPAMRALRYVDPMNIILGQFRDILYYGHISRPGHLLLMMAVSTGALVTTLVAFRRLTRHLAKDVR
ncbi:MAG TPA: hypothetical protein VH134_10470, partial [Candidatus Dormibacteraeota bacterium]|nr:hypothetical protein [Candidatus Dormibacteraeota bacterium]